MQLSKYILQRQTNADGPLCQQQKAGEHENYSRGRTQCQARDLCYRGCPCGRISVPVLPRFPGQKKGSRNLTLHPDSSCFHSIIYDEQKEK